MILTSRIELQQGTYMGVLDLERSLPASLTEQERRALVLLGSPIVDCGGTFVQLAGELYAIEGGGFSLPADNRVFPDHFPATIRFSITDYPDAGARVHAWVSGMRDRLVAAVAAKVAAMPSVPTGTTITTHSTSPAP